MEARHLKEPVFKGSCTAMITPFSDSGIDYERLERQIEFQAANGTAALVIAGTTGEAATLSEREYMSLLAFSVRKSAHRMKVIAGIGGNDTQKCLENARFSESAGADALLMTAPYYNKTTPEGLKTHFLTVADRVGLPRILYDVPGRTAVEIPAEVFEALAAHPNVNGVKAASGNFSVLSRIAANCRGTLHLWSGNDDHTIAMMALGALGVISVGSNLEPAVVAQICKLCLNGDFAAANALNDRYSALWRALFLETNPIPVKAAMQLRGTDSGILRPPLVPISEENRAILHACL